MFVEINVMRNEAGRGARDASSFPLTFFEKAIDILNFVFKSSSKEYKQKKKYFMILIFAFKLYISCYA